MSSEYTVLKIDNTSEADITREAKEIPGKTIVIPYKNWKEINHPSKVYRIPIEFCFFRKDNGRIKDDLKSIEKEKGVLAERDPETQKILKDFLFNSDQKKNEELKKYLVEQGQREPAIITADGFLINGNRRRMILEELFNETGDDRYKQIEVCILPGTGKPERPDPLSIALLENRLQNFEEGKSEYTNMNKALKAKDDLKHTRLEALLRDDPKFYDKDPKNFKKKQEEFLDRYLRPLELMDQYLELNRVPQNYHLVKDRWDVFAEAYKYVSKKLNDRNFLISKEFQDRDKAKILQATFNIIKLDNKKSHQIDKRRAEIVRDIFRKFAGKETKNQLLKLGEIEVGAQHSEDVIESYNEWQEHEGIQVLNALKALRNISQKIDEKETPLSRLEEALQKLTNEKVWSPDLLRTMSLPEADKCRKVTIKIQSATKALYRLFEKFKDKEEALREFVKDLNENRK